MTTCFVSVIYIHWKFEFQFSMLFFYFCMMEQILRDDTVTQALYLVQYIGLCFVLANILIYALSMYMWHLTSIFD